MMMAIAVLALAACSDKNNVTQHPFAPDQISAAGISCAPSLSETDCTQARSLVSTFLNARTTQPGFAYDSRANVVTPYQLTWDLGFAVSDAFRNKGYGFVLSVVTADVSLPVGFIGVTGHDGKVEGITEVIWVESGPWQSNAAVSYAAEVASYPARVAAAAEARRIERAKAFDKAREITANP
jgi:hypothetical protein